ncbi:hypothetical protein DFH09DRAFT_1081546 [Mycena vulgaris]|nr:hypothetical protein DFH09DRAFT_1081546 [Mycena vulgaris]
MSTPDENPIYHPEAMPTLLLVAQHVKSWLLLPAKVLYDGAVNGRRERTLPQLGRVIASRPAFFFYDHVRHVPFAVHLDLDGWYKSSWLAWAGLAQLPRLAYLAFHHNLVPASVCQGALAHYVAADLRFGMVVVADELEDWEMGARRGENYWVWSKSVARAKSKTASLPKRNSWRWLNDRRRTLQTVSTFTFDFPVRASSLVGVPAPVKSMYTIRTSAILRFCFPSSPHLMLRKFEAGLIPLILNTAPFVPAFRLLAINCAELVSTKWYI